MFRLASIFLISGFVVSVQASALRCANLFAVEAPRVVIQVLKKSETQKYFGKLKTKNIDPDLFNIVQLTLIEIKERGTSSLNKDQIESLAEFRKQTSILRSAYELLSESHQSPKKFDNFVKDIGKLKDFASAKEDQRSRDLARYVLESMTLEKLNKLMSGSELANRQSISKYITSKLDLIKNLLLKNDKSLEEVHDMRKAFRNIFRYMEIQKKVLDLKKSDKAILQSHIDHVNELNDDLAAVCDVYNPLVMQGKMTKHDRVELPSELYHKIEQFLTYASLENR